MVDKKVSIGIEYQEIGAEVVKKVISNVKSLTSSINELGKLKTDFDALSSSAKKLASAGLDSFNNQIKSIATNASRIKMEQMFPVTAIRSFAREAVNAGVSIEDIVRTFPSLQKAMPIWVAHQRAIQGYNNEIESLNQRYYDTIARSSLTTEELKRLGESAMRAGVSISTISKEYPSMEIKMPDWLGEMKSIEKYNKTLSDLNAKYYEVQGQTKLSAEQLRKLGEAAVAAGVSIDTITKEFPEMDIKIPEFTSSQRAIETYRGQLTAAAQSCTTLAAAHNLPLEKVKELGDAAIMQGASFQKVVSILPQYITALRTLGTDQQKLNVVIAESSPIVSKTIESISAFAGKSGEAANRLGSLQNALVNVSIGLDPLKKGINNFSQSLSSLWTSINKGITNLTRFSLVIFTLRELFGRLARDVINLVNQFAEFDKYISSAAAAAMEYGETFDVLHEKFLDMALSIAGMGKAAFAPTDIANALNELAKAGVDVSNVTDSQLVPILNLAQANFASLGDTVNIVSAVMAGFQLDMTNSAKIADVLTKAAFESRLSFEEFGKGFMEVGAMASVVNVSLEEVASAMVLTTNAGWSANEAATSFLRLAGELINQTSSAAQLFESVGISIVDVQNGSVNLADAFQRLIDAGVTENQILDAFNERSQRMALAIYQNVERFRELTKSMEESSGFSEEMAEKMLSTFSGLAQTIKNQFSAILDMFLAAFAPAMGKIMSFFSKEVLPTIYKATEGLRDAFKGLDFSDLEGAMASLGRSVVNVIEQLAKSPESFNNIIMMIGNFAQVGMVFLEGLIKIFDKLTPYLDEITSGLAGLATMWIINKVNLAGFVTQIWGGIKGLSNLVVTGVSGLIGLVKGTKTLRVAIVATGQAAKASMAAATMGLSLIIATIVELILNFDNLKEAATRAFDWIVVKFHDAMKALGSMPVLGFLPKQIAEGMEATKVYTDAALRESDRATQKMLENYDAYAEEVKKKQEEAIAPYKFLLEEGLVTPELKEYLETMIEDSEKIPKMLDTSSKKIIQVTTKAEEWVTADEQHLATLKKIAEEEGGLDEDTQKLVEDYERLVKIDNEILSGKQKAIDLEEQRAYELAQAGDDEEKKNAIIEKYAEKYKELSDYINGLLEERNGIQKEYNQGQKETNKNVEELASDIDDVNSYMQKLPETFETITGTVQDLVDWIGELSLPGYTFEDFGEKAAKALPNIQELVKIVEQMLQLLQSEEWKEAITRLGRGIIDIGKQLGEMLNAEELELEKKVLTDFVSIIDTILSLFETFNKLSTNIYPTMSNIINGFTRLTDEFENLAKWMQTDDFESLLETLKESAEIVTKEISSFTTTMNYTMETIEMFNNEINTLLGLFDTFGKVADTPILSIEKLENGFKNLTISVMNMEEFFSGDMWKSIEIIMTSTLKSISNSFTDFIQSIGDLSELESFSAAFETILSFLDLATKVSETTRISLFDLSKGFVNLTSNIKAFTTLAPTYITNIINALETLRQSDFGKWFSEWMDLYGQDTTNFISNTSNLLDGINSLSKGLLEFSDISILEALSSVKKFEVSIRNISFAFTRYQDDIINALLDLKSALEPILVVWNEVMQPLQDVINMMNEIQTAFITASNSALTVVKSIRSIVDSAKYLKDNEDVIKEAIETLNETIDLVVKLSGESEVKSGLSSIEEIINRIKLLSEITIKIKIDKYEEIINQLNKINDSLGNINLPEGKLSIISPTVTTEQKTGKTTEGEVNVEVTTEIETESEKKTEYPYYKPTTPGKETEQPPWVSSPKEPTKTEEEKKEPEKVEEEKTAYEKMGEELERIRKLNEDSNKQLENEVNVQEAIKNLLGSNIPKVEPVSPDNIPGSLGKLSNILGLLGNLGGPLGLLGDALGSLGKLGDLLLNNLGSKILETFVNLGKTILDPIKASGEKLMESFGTLISLPMDIISSAITGFVNLILSPVNMFSDSLTKISESIISLVISPLTGATKIIEGLFNTFTNSVTGLIESISKIFTFPIDVIGAALQDVLNILLVVPNMATNIFSAITENLTSLFTWLPRSINTILSSITDSIVKLLPTSIISDMLNNVTNSITELATYVPNKIRDKMDSIIDSAMKYIEMPANLLTSTIDKVVDNYLKLLSFPTDVMMSSLEKFTDNIITFANLPFDIISSSITDMINKIINLPFDVVSNILTTFTDKLIEAAGLPIDNLINSINTLSNTIMESALLPFTVLINTVNNLSTEFTNLLTIPFTILTEGFNALSGNITSLLSIPITSITNLFESLVSSLQEFISVPFTSLIAYFNSITDSVSSFATLPLNSMINIINSVVESISTLASLPIDMFVNMINNIITNISNLISLPFNIIIDNLTKFGENLSSIISLPITSYINIVESFMSSLGDLLSLPLNTIINFVDSFTSVAGDFLSLPITTLISSISDFSHTLTTFLTSPITSLIDSIVNIVDKSVSFLTLGLSLATDLISDLFSKMVTAITLPMDLIIDTTNELSDSFLKITTLPIDLIVDNLNKFSDILVSIITLPWTTVSDTIDSLVSGVNNLLVSPFTFINDFIDTMRKNLSDLISLPVSSITTLFNNLSDILSELISFPLTAMMDIFNNIIENLSSFLGLPFATFTDSFSEIISTFNDFISLPFSQFENIIDNLINTFALLPITTLSDLFNNLSDSVSEFLTLPTSSISNIIENIFDSLSSLSAIPFDTITNLFSSLEETISNILSFPFDSLLNSMENITDRVNSLATYPIDTILDSFTEVQGDILDVLMISSTTIMDAIDTVSNSFLDLITIPLNEFTNLISSINDIFTEFLSLPLDSIVDVINSFVDNISDFVTLPFTSFINIIDGFINSVSEFVSMPISSYIDSINKFMNTLSDILSLPLSSFVNIVSKFVDLITDIGFAPLINFLDLITKVNDGITNLILLPIETISKIIDDLTGSIISLATAPITEVVQMITDIFNMLSSVFTAPFKELIDTISKMVDILEEIVLPPLEEFASLLYSTFKPINALNSMFKSVRSFDTGGYVEKDMLGFLHGGEYVIPKGGNHNQVINLYINNSVNNQSDIDSIADAIFRKLERYTSF